MFINLLGTIKTIRLISIIAIFAFCIALLPKAVNAGIILRPPLASGLVGYWSFDEGSGNTIAHDQGPHKINGELTNMDVNRDWVSAVGTSTPSQRTGTALDFDGTNDAVTFPIGSLGNQLNGTSGFTASVWVNARSYATGDRIMQFFLTNTEEALNWKFDTAAAGDVKCQARSTSSDTTKTVDLASPVIPKHTWVHLVCVVDYTNATVKIYRNGVLDATLSTTFNASTFTLGTLTTAVDSIADTGAGIDGMLDEVRIYKRVLSDVEIKRLYKMSRPQLRSRLKAGTATSTINASQNAKITAGLVGMWSFNGPNVDMASKNAQDVSGGGNIASLTNGPKPAPGKVGQGLLFNGSNSSADICTSGCSLNPSTDDWTEVAWIEPVSVVGTKFIFINGDTNGPNFAGNYLQIASSTIAGTATVGNDSQGTCVTHRGDITTLSPNTWYHVALTKFNTLLTCYLNGKDTGSVTLSSATMDSGGAIFTRIGADDGGTNGFNGVIDEVRTYSRALSAAEVRRLYNLGR